LRAGETGSDGLGGEVCAPFTFLRFKISNASDRFTGDANTDSLGRPYVLPTRADTPPVLNMRSSEGCTAERTMRSAHELNEAVDLRPTG
jgi:hypothetical protein